MIVVTSGRRQGQMMTKTIMAEIEATGLHQCLSDIGFRLQPFRMPAGLTRGNLRLRLTWKKESGGEVQTVRLTHTVTVPNRA